MPLIVKNTTFPGLLDLLAPHSCMGCGRLGEPLCHCCKKYIIDACVRDFCPNCRQSRLGIEAWPRLRNNDTEAGYFKHGDNKIKKPNSSINYLKYHKNNYLPYTCPYCHLPLAYVVGHREGLLSALIRGYKYESTRAFAPVFADILHYILPRNLPKNTIIVPLPTATKHIRARGMDHTYLIARRLGRLRCLPVQSVLVRDKNTVQVGATRRERIKQAPKAYNINTTFRLDFSATYMLLDDVWTTGASMKSAIELLQGTGVSVEHIRIALLAVSD